MEEIINTTTKAIIAFNIYHNKQRSQTAPQDKPFMAIYCCFHTKFS